MFNGYFSCYGVYRCNYENLISCADQIFLIDTKTFLEVGVLDHMNDASHKLDVIA